MIAKYTSARNDSSFLKGLAWNALVITVVAVVLLIVLKPAHTHVIYWRADLGNRRRRPSGLYVTA